MVELEEPHLYYVAGILVFCENKIDGTGSGYIDALIKGSNFQIDKLGKFCVDADNEVGLLRNKKLREIAITTLVGFGYAEVIEDEFGPTMLSVEHRIKSESLMGGTETPLKQLASRFPESVFASTNKFGSEWLGQAIEKINSSIESADGNDSLTSGLEPSFAVDDIWKPLPINRSAPEFEETIAGIEEAIREIAADNGFSSTFPEERDNLVEHANTTLKSVKEGKVTRKQIVEHLISTGKWVASKFTGSAIGFAGKSLMMWGLKLLGLF